LLADHHGGAYCSSEVTLRAVGYAFGDFSGTIL
jgi:ribosomal protein S19